MSKKREWELRDPEAKAEARNYAHPVPSRTYILRFLEERGVPVPFDDLAEAFELDPRERRALTVRLKAMVRDGQLIPNRRAGYCLVDRIALVTGVVNAHRDGFGYVVPDQDGADDVYLSPRSMRQLMHGDRVAVRIRGHDRRGRPEGSLVEVLERNTSSVVGKYRRKHGVGFVVPENPRIQHRIVVPGDAVATARPGQIVLVKITAQPTPHSQPIGRVVKVLGRPNAPGIEIEIAIHAHGLPTEWPKAVERAVRRLGKDVPAEAKRGREDLRHLPLLTIDGADARDFDDAVFCEPTASGWRLYVAIADVAHYVEAGAPLDEEARNRGTSVYFTRRVLPMLPELLSNGLCSLNPKVDRLCMVCEMRVGRDGKVSRPRFFEGVMRSHARLTYEEVAAMLFDGDAELRREHVQLLPHLEDLHDVFRALLAQRRKRGAIDFDIPEAYVELGEDRRIESISTYERNDAHRMIEECMIAANVSAARFLDRHELPTLYRVHDKPTEERFKDLKAFLATFGVPFPRVKEIQPRHFAQVLDRIKGKPYHTLVETVLLRSMARATYQPDNLGHFGLALPQYVHFTSPIRRYPDLLVHRAIKHALTGKKPDSFSYTPKDMDRLGKHCSMTEKRADDATRDAIAWLKCEFMLDKIGEVFEGVITGVTSFGVFVQLQDVFVEGLVHVTSLENDYYEFDASRHRLFGARTKKVYQLAAPLRVRVANVDMEQRRIDFEPVEPKVRSTAKRAPGKVPDGASRGRRRPTRPKRRRG
ncbi:MAG: ribonuclease R [Deltaproteobacteria bacterium]|nr:ribonuclease R [Deltaproteobacteria bacterium]MBW2362067.1 ribonuclease R [Deltaproteobacteria bacterium]